MIVEHHNLTITRKTSGSIPDVNFLNIKNHILGKSYELSLVFPDTVESIKLHKKFKSKNDPVNILSFPLSNTEGEIFITLSQARRECKKWNMHYHQYLTYLCIHGCTHLRGLDHGSEMDTLEKKYCSYFNIPYPYNDE
jgi:probable rRNA maturation factor